MGDQILTLADRTLSSVGFQRDNNIPKIIKVLVVILFGDSKRNKYHSGNQSFAFIRIQQSRETREDRV